MHTNIKIVGKRLTLVPYEKEHVETYHKWMKDPWLQEMTASEPLSLEAEYEMQESWHNDPKKCTFILMDGEDSSNKMIGDVNLFFNVYDSPAECEIEIMIAESDYRRRGFATEALNLMMLYGVAKLNVERFFAKIGDRNKSSAELFQQKLNYNFVNYVKAFEETEYEFIVSPEKRQELLERWDTTVLKL